MQSTATKDGDSEVLGLCLSLRSDAAPPPASASEVGTEGGSRGKTRKGTGAGKVGGEPDAASAEVVLLTADKALQVSAMLEGVRTMPIASWMQGGD